MKSICLTLHCPHPQKNSTSIFIFGWGKGRTATLGSSPRCRAKRKTARRCSCGNRNITTLQKRTFQSHRDRGCFSARLYTFRRRHSMDRWIAPTRCRGHKWKELPWAQARRETVACGSSAQKTRQWWICEMSNDGRTDREITVRPMLLPIGKPAEIMGASKIPPPWSIMVTVCFPRRVANGSNYSPLDNGIFRNIVQAEQALSVLCLVID